MEDHKELSPAEQKERLVKTLKELTDLIEKEDSHCGLLLFFVSDTDDQVVVSTISTNIFEIGSSIVALAVAENEPSGLIKYSEFEKTVKELSKSCSNVLEKVTKLGLDNYVNSLEETKEII